MKIFSLVRMIRGMIHIDFNGDIGKTVFLAGVGRGGTTWISEIINHRNEYRYMFEPFYPRYVGLFREFKGIPYVRPGEGNTNILTSAHKIFSGRITHPWIDRFNRKILCDKRLIKDIRTNLKLKWLKDAFPDIKIILILRHPFAVARSKMKLGWHVSLQPVLNQPELIEDYLTPFMSTIEDCKTSFEKEVCLWCIQNYLPLAQFRDTGGIYVGFYERFCLDTIQETRALFRWLKQDDSSLEQKNLNNPSKMSKKHSAVLSGGDLVRTWMGTWSRSEIQRGVKILSNFGLDEIYNETPIPREDFTYL